MKQLVIVLAVLLLAVSFGATAANAQTQVQLSVPTSGVVGFSSSSPGTISMCSTTCTLTNSSGTGLVVGSGGTPIITGGDYSLKLNAASLTLSGTNFTVGAGTGTGTLTFTVPGGSVTMSLQLTLVEDGSPTPTLVGTYVVTGATGVLSSLFSGMNADGSFDVTLGLTGCPLETLANDPESCTSPSASGRFRSGDTLGATPEPSSILLFGTGLLACGVFLRRRLT